MARKKGPALQVLTIGPGATIREVAKRLGIPEAAFWADIDNGRILLIAVRVSSEDPG